MTAAALSLLAAAIWLYLLLGRGGFWLTRERDTNIFASTPGNGNPWPSVTAIVPARNEADVIATTLSSLLAQDYPGPFHIVLVDDQSDDGTGAIARALDNPDRLIVLSGAARPPGWTGKLWAVSQGVDAAVGFVEEQIEAGAFDGGVARCRATTRKGKACQRTPLPNRDYCPSHQHLERSKAAA